MYSIELNRAIFLGARETILLTGSAAKVIGAAAPVRFGYSAAHKGSGPAKYNNTARALDYLLVTKNVKCLEGENSIYAEITSGSKVYKVVCDGETDLYDDERPHGSLKFIPMVLYHLRSASSNSELKDCFAKICKSYDETGCAELEDVVRFCDCFYYTIAAPATSPFVIEENALQMATVNAAIRTGELQPFEAPLDEFIPSVYGEREVETSKSATKAPAADPFENIKSGEKIITFDWKEHQKSKIPTLESLNDFVPSPEYYSILNKICVRLNKVNLRVDAGITGVEAIGKDYINLMMVGKPGTGKTTLAYALGAATGMPTYSVSLNKDSESDVFQGMTKVVDGKLEFVSTDFLDAYTNGGIIILEEINLANPNVVMGTIGQSIEYPFVLMENGYKPIRRHPMCVVIGTMNVGTYGSAALNEALSSRFKTTYVLDDPADQDFINILCKAGGTVKASKWVLGVYKKLIHYLMSPSVNAEDICMRLTMRGCIGALEAIEEGEESKQAIRRTLIGKIAESDLELANIVWKDVVQAIPPLK